MPCRQNIILNSCLPVVMANWQYWIFAIFAFAVFAQAVAWAGCFYAAISGETPRDEEAWPTWATIYYPSMCVVAILNITLYVLVAKTRQFDEDIPLQTYQRRARALAAPYVLVCAYRTFFPNNYLSRTVWWNVFASSILLARTMSTVSELCWIAQISSALSFYSRHLHNASSGCDASKKYGIYTYVQTAARLMFICICVAECCSFVATITTNPLFFAFEESLWGIAYLITMPGYIYVFLSARKLRTSQQVQDGKIVGLFYIELFGFLASFFCLFYIPWVATVDVPPYFRMYGTDLEQGKQYLSFREGVRDALTTLIVTRSWSTWGGILWGMVWRNTYFGPNVWACIGIALAPAVKLEVVTEPLSPKMQA